MHLLNKLIPTQSITAVTTSYRHFACIRHMTGGVSGDDKAVNTEHVGGGYDVLCVTHSVTAVNLMVKDES